MTIRAATRRAQAAQARADEARKVLYEAIRKARADGMTLRAIAAQTDLSFARIAQITKSD